MAFANTASLSTNLNVDPYYDDFDESKNFHRVLFRPGLAVQARELTQLQTILQNQIDRFGEHIFKEGSTVRGLEMVYDRNAKFVKLRDADSSGTTVNAAAFVGSIVTGATSGVTAYVLDSLDGAEANNPNIKTLYIRYTGSGTAGTTAAFQSGEVLTSNTALSANVVTANATVTATGTGSRIIFGEGILYAKDHFIRVPTSNTIIGRYDANTNAKVGFTINETLVNSDTDTTLLDPAQGAYNYAAPGANRLKLTPVLTVKNLTDVDDANFVERMRIKNGDPYMKQDKPMYSIINEYIARRTYDESGDYIVKGLYAKVREHLNSANNGGYYTAGQGGDSNKLVVTVAPGKAYIKGFETDLVSSRVAAVDKGTDYETVDDLPITMQYGNYIQVNEAVGTWDINGHDRVSFYNTPFNAISNGTFSTSSVTGRTKIGEARIRAFEHSSGEKGDADCTYNMYIYDIVETANNISAVRGVYFDDSTYDGVADTVVTSGNTVLIETKFNTGVFNIPSSYVKTVREADGTTIDNDFIFYDEFDVTLAADGTVTVTTDGADEIFNLSTGAVSATNKKANFHMVLKGSATSSATLGTATLSDQGHTISFTGASSKLNVGEVIAVAGYSNTFTINSVATNSFTTYELGLNATAGALTKSFQPGQVINLSGVGGDGGSRSVTIDSSTQASIDIDETLSSGTTARVFAKLKKQNGQEIAKTINEGRYVELNISQGHSNTQVGSPGTSGPYNLGLSDGHKLREIRVKTGNTYFANTSEGTDVTREFELDTGMRDNLYTHSKLLLKPGSTHTIANGNVYLVKLDFFTHDTSSGVGYFSVDSYPIDDVNTANTNAIQTAEIPVFTSPTTGNRFDLRNCIDIRPRITDTANNVSSITNITRNPATSTAVVEPASGLRYPAPNENFTIDYQYYLPRRDRIVITKTGNVHVIKGVPDLEPRTPAQAADGMTIAIVHVKPYPSLPQENAGRISTATAKQGRADLAVRIEPRRIRRYTMRDIGGLEERIDNLEYYTSLSLLEADTKSLFLADGSGIDRFKNGIIVDQFVDFTSSDFYNEGYKISIDRDKKEARPSYKIDDIQLEFLSANSTNATATSKDTTVTIAVSGSYSNGETVTQGAASGTLVYQVGTRLYLENVSGTFTTSANVVGGTSSTSRAVSSVASPAAGKLITLPYTHSLAIDQSTASTTRNAAGLFYSYRGQLTLNPDTDYWQDVTVAPAVQIDFGNFAEALQQIANQVGTQWNGWNTVNVATNINAAGITTVTNQRRSGTQLVVQAGQLRQTDLGESIQDLNIIPHMRSREIQFNASGMKPSTRLYAFFDNEDVTSYITPTDSSFANTANEGSNLLSDANGNVYGIFRLPNNDQLRFLNGNLRLRLSDSPTNETLQGLFTTSTAAVYSAQGLEVFKQGAVISTRDIDVSSRQVFDTRTSSSFVAFPPPADSGGDGDGDAGDGGDGGDPIAQSFRVDDGNSSSSSAAFLTKVDLYFRTKDPTLPVQLEIIEVDPSTSYLTNRVVPFSKIEVPAADINVSDDGSAPTPIIFETPIYLLRGEQYAIKVKPGGNNPNVAVWTARLGEDDFITGNRITKQPAAGMLFASANDLQYTPVQEEDLKFKLYFANFGSNQTGTAVFKNVDKEYFTLANTDSISIFNRVGETVHGESTITFTSQPSANVGLSLLSTAGSGTGANGVLTFNSANTVRVKEVTTATKFQAGDTITVMNADGSATGTTATIHSVTTPTGKVYFYDAVTQSNTFLHLSEPSGSFAANTWVRGQISGLDARIKTVENLNADLFNARVGKLIPDGTSLSATAKFATAPASLDTAFRTFNISGDNIYANRKYIFSRSNEVANISSQKSGEVRFTLGNSQSELSPVIDNDRAAVLTVENLINNDSTNEDTQDVGNALARYVMRTVTLDDGQDAEDLKVFVGAYKPATATIKVYAKLLNGEDGQDMDDKTWIDMTQVTPATVYSDSENQQDFEEYEYTLPTANLTGDNGEVQYTTTDGVTFTGFKRFKIKVVLLSTSTSRVPRIRDFRAVALQI